MTEQKQLEQAIAHLETQRAVLGDAVVEASIAALREKLATLEAPLAAQASPPRAGGIRGGAKQQRKQVTVLLADVSSSTAMAESMDPEDVTEMMNALWERLDRVITEHGGTIDKHIGDAVMALWGAETAREDDPERAIRAALAIQAELATFSEGRSLDAAQDRRGDLAMRIGVNTGPVLLGEVGTTGEYTAMGDTVNTASRLEGAAPVGGVLISHDTYRHVRGVFDVQALEPLQVKGKAELLQVYLVQQAKPRAFRRGTRGVEGVETRLIGREAELKCLQEALYVVLEDHERQMITITGEAGIGKSRLLYEFENWLELLPEPIRYFKGRASPEMQTLPYALLRNLFAFRFQIQDSDRARVVREKMEEGIAEALGAGQGSQMKAHFIGQLLGYDFSDSPHLRAVLDDTQQLRDRALAYLSEFFQATTELAPAVIFLEDVHWADDSSLDAINHLALTPPEGRLLILCLARPSLFERRPHWGDPSASLPRHGRARGRGQGAGPGRAGGQAFHRRLELQPLSRWDSHRLVEEILQKVDQLPPELRELVVSGAEGNPFYVEELIKMLIEDGVIIKGEERWHVEPIRLTAIRVPPTLTGVLQARLDSLPSRERTILQQASVVGRRFWDSAVVRISESAGEETATVEMPKALAALRGKELIFRRATSAFAGTQEYIFKHAILREVTYESVLKRVRRVYHALVAEWLIQHSGERAAEVTGLIADHLELAGQIERAATYLRRAGEGAAAQSASAEAVNYLSRALNLTSETDYAERYALLLAREKVYDLQGTREAQCQDLTALEMLADALADDRRRAEVTLRRAYYSNATGNYPASIEAAQAAIHLARTVRDVQSEAASFLEWGRACLRQADYATACTQFEQSLALARVAQLPDVEAGSLLGLGIVAYNRGDYTTAAACYEQALDLKRESGDRRSESAALINLGAVASSQGDYAGARAYYEQALRLKREIGDRRGESLALGNLGNVAFHQGDYTDAKAYYEQALRLKCETGDRYGEGNARCNLGRLTLRLGDYAAARAYFEQALRLLRDIGERYGESHTLVGQGQLLHHLGDDEAAREYSQQALLIARELALRSVEGAALTVLGHALVSSGRLDEAADAYRQALDLQRELGEHNLAIESLAGLARISLAQGNLSNALAQAEEILSYLQSHTLEGTEEPFQVYLTCHHVLRASQDPRSGEILETAHTLLQEQAARISDEELRHSFLENVAAHREIVNQWRI